MSKENSPQPVGRVVRVGQPQFIDVTYWGPDRYVDHRFDKIFAGAEKDSERPEGFHPGWWVVHREYIKQATKGGILLTELPVRYLGNLKPLIHLPEIVAANPDPDAFESLYHAFLIFSKVGSFKQWTPEQELANMVAQFHNDVIRFAVKHKWDRTIT